MREKENILMNDDTGLTEAYGYLDSGVNSLNTMIVANSSNTINDTIDDILKMEIPEKYKKY
jgi:hypothetical protein